MVDALAWGGGAARLWENDDKFEVVAALVVAKFEALPPPKHNDRPIHRRWRTRAK